MYFLYLLFLFIICLSGRSVSVTLQSPLHKSDPQSFLTFCSSWHQEGLGEEGRHYAGISIRMEAQVQRQLLKRGSSIHQAVDRGAFSFTTGSIKHPIVNNCLVHLFHLHLLQGWKTCLPTNSLLFIQSVLWELSAYHQEGKIWI